MHGTRGVGRLAGIAAGLVAGLAACALPGPPTQHPATQQGQQQSANSSPSPSPSPSAEQTSSSVQQPTTRPSSAAGQPCQVSDLKVMLDPQHSDADMQGDNYPLQFTNTGPAACTLQGFPGVSYVDSNGAQVGPAAVRVGPGGPQLSLPPGNQTVSAVLRDSQE